MVYQVNMWRKIVRVKLVASIQYSATNTEKCDFSGNCRIAELHLARCPCTDVGLPYAIDDRAVLRPYLR